MKSKLLIIITDIIIIILGIIFLVFGIKDFIKYNNSRQIDSATKFQREFDYIKEEHIYEYLSLKDMVNIFKQNKDAIILVGSSLDPWTQVLVSPLNDILTKTDKKIGYFSIKEDYSANNKDYNYLLTKLNIKKMETPIIIKIKNGVVVEELSKFDIYEKNSEDIPLEYWNEDRLKQLRKIVIDFLK